ncbi:MAG: nucleoside-diphosphate-sugar pyrophosphorylase [Candidatus Rokuibacteriota bacterium]|nr:MAG: nucleoside-diphosphate-sugar pyrophosphorylase [Candidatus Rokubacteria bacterium]
MLVLAAGYATRLYPLTLETPKPLLSVGGRPMVENVLNAAEPIGAESTYLVTNSKFVRQFREWASTYEREVRIVDDGTNDDASRRGAIGDLALVVEQERIQDDLVVVAGDNLFGERLEGFPPRRDAPVLAVYDVGDLERIREYNAIEVDGDGRISFFEEKPAEPRSTLTGIALYSYPRHTLPEIGRYLAEGGNPDQPGRLVQWLYPQMPVYTWRVPGLWFDVGSKDQLAEADRIFSAQA